MIKALKEARKQESGFTLVELLIVIVILGVLAGIVVFAVSAFNNDGKAAACKSDFKNVEIAQEAYYAKNNSTYATSIGALVTAGYLKEPPGNSGYTIAINSSTGAVTATGACTLP
jgi:prepilin-type N-terminal cleavage/methylation domain-containing protein